MSEPEAKPFSATGYQESTAQKLHKRFNNAFSHQRWSRSYTCTPRIAHTSVTYEKTQMLPFFRCHVVNTAFFRLWAYTNKPAVNDPTYFWRYNVITFHARSSWARAEQATGGCGDYWRVHSLPGTAQASLKEQQNILKLENGCLLYLQRSTHLLPRNTGNISDKRNWSNKRWGT